MAKGFQKKKRREQSIATKLKHKCHKTLSYRIIFIFIEIVKQKRDSVTSTHFCKVEKHHFIWLLARKSLFLSWIRKLYIAKRQEEKDFIFCYLIDFQSDANHLEVST